MNQFIWYIKDESQNRQIEILDEIPVPRLKQYIDELEQIRRGPHYVRPDHQEAAYPRLLEARLYKLAQEYHSTQLSVRSLECPKWVPKRIQNLLKSAGVNLVVDRCRGCAVARRNKQLLQEVIGAKEQYGVIGDLPWRCGGHAECDQGW